MDIMENCTEEFPDITEIANVVGCSRRQLERLFRDNIGLSPVRYYRDLRLDRAKRLLSETRLSCMEVVVACGFNGAESFRNAFRRRFGISPLGARRIAGASSATTGRTA